MSHVLTLPEIRAKAYRGLFPAPSVSSPATVSHHRSKAGAKGMALGGGAKLRTKRDHSPRPCTACGKLHTLLDAASRPRATCSDACRAKAKLKWKPEPAPRQLCNRAACENRVNRPRDKSCSARCAMLVRNGAETRT